MSDAPKPVKFKAPLTTSDGTPVYHYLRFPKDKVKHFAFKGNLRRVICTLNGKETFNCALFPSKDHYLIALNKKLRDKLGLAVGDQVTIELAKDDGGKADAARTSVIKLIDENKVAAVLDSRFASGNMGRHELAKAKEQYGKLTLESARRLLKFWQVRAADAPPKTG